MLGHVSDIDLRLLRLFATIVQSGGFSLAAARLNISESTVSSHMSDLEARLGFRTCERGRAGFRLTKKGKQVYEITTEFLAQLDGYRDRLAKVATRRTNALRIGIPDAFYTCTELPLHRYFEHFSKTFPDIHLYVHMLGVRDLERQLVEGALDLAFAPQNRPVSGIDYAPVATETNFLYCSESHPLFSVPDEDITDEMLEDAGMISLGYLERLDSPFFDNPHHFATVYHIASAFPLIRSGRFIGFLPDHFAAAMSGCTLRPLRPKDIRINVVFSLISRRGQEPDPFLETFRQCVFPHEVAEASSEVASKKSGKASALQPMAVSVRGP